MAKAGVPKIAKYGDRFKATTVKLSSFPGVRIKDVAATLDIHPFMLSLWQADQGEGDRGEAIQAGCRDHGRAAKA